MISPFSLAGRFIRLTPLRLDDLDDLCAIGLDPSLWQSTTIQVVSRGDMEAYVQAALAAQHRGTAVPFAIFERTTDKLIGSTRFHSIEFAHRRLEIGFTWLGCPWQRTFANTEAKYLMLYHAFEHLGCIRVEFRADSGTKNRGER